MIEETFKIIDKIIEAQKKARRENDYLTLLSNAEALLEYLPKLIEYSVEQESQYRKFEAALSDKVSDETTGKRNTSAYCETQSKATDFYKNWQKTKLFIDLVYEMVNISKKLMSSVNNEFNTQ